MNLSFDETPTYVQIYRHALSILSYHCEDIEALQYDLSCLFSHIFSLNRYDLALKGDLVPQKEAVEAFRCLLERYIDGEPLQYLIGQWEFYGLPFEVGPGVLIPRPDTETLVEFALSFLKDATNPAVADLCSGSGCVAISIAHLRPDADVFALELSGDAFAYLEKNLEHNHVSVTCIQCDVLSPPKLPPLDLIVSNPPYISAQDMAALQKQVRYEPALALAGGTDGCDFYRALPQLYAPFLKPGGAIAFEVGYDQAATVAGLLAQAGYHSVHVHNDLSGIGRVVSGIK